MEKVKTFVIGSTPFLGIIFLVLTMAAIEKGHVFYMFLYGILMQVALLVAICMAVFSWKFWEPQEGIFKSEPFSEHYQTPLRLVLGVMLLSWCINTGVLVMFATPSSTFLRTSLILLGGELFLLGFSIAAVIMGFVKTMEAHRHDFEAPG